MEENPKISVIIPVYNTAQYLPRCLDSILKNTYSNLEILCVDDGSTDKSGDILDEYAKKDPRVSVIHQTNAGISAARNAGIEATDGEFAAFIDSDDWIHPMYFAELVRAQKLCDADVTFCGYTNAFAHFEPEELIPGQAEQLSLEQVLENGVLKRLCWGRLYRRDILGGVRYDTALTWGEDTTFNFQVFFGREGLRFVRLDSVLYYYFQRESSVSGTVSLEKCMQLARWYLEHYHMQPSEMGQRILLEQAIKESLSNRYRASFSGNRERYDQCKKLLNEAVSKMSGSGLSSVSRIAKYTILSRCPWAYRLFRIISDPTMLVWEKNQRMKLRK